MTLADNLWVCVWTPGFAVRSGIVLPLDLDSSWRKVLKAEVKAVLQGSVGASTHSVMFGLIFSNKSQIIAKRTRCFKVLKTILL